MSMDEVLRESVASLRAEVTEYDEILRKQSRILTGIANIVNGEPGKLQQWSHHDLVAKVQALYDEVVRLDGEITWLIKQPPVCPECAAGKHPNCNGLAWDHRRAEFGGDQETQCVCSAAGHSR